MIRVYADFNERTADGACTLLRHEECDLQDKFRDLGLSEGSTVLLYQDEDDFEVEAVLAFEDVESGQPNSLVAYPDWSRFVRK